MLKRFGYVLRCNCGEPFSVWTMKRRGQFLHSKTDGGCGNRPRADFRGGGSASVISGPYTQRHEGENEVKILLHQEADQEGLVKLKEEQINYRIKEAGLPSVESKTILKDERRTINMESSYTNWYKRQR
mgnify:CR=1 FL=1